MLALRWSKSAVFPWSQNFQYCVVSLTGSHFNTQVDPRTGGGWDVLRKQLR